MTPAARGGIAPGAADERSAITVGGHSTSYASFAGLVQQLQPCPPIRDLTGLPVLDALAAVFAAAAAGAAVLVRDPATPAPELPALRSDAFLVALTSGTSGHPRAVVRTAGSWGDSFAPLAALAGLSRADTVLLTGPLHATLHLFAAVHTLWLGAHLTDEPATATAVHAVPTVLGKLLQDPPPRWRTAVVAGAAVPAALEVRALAAGVRLVEYYGAAELSFVAARVAPERLRAFPGVEISTRAGALWVRSPYLATDRLTGGQLLPVADADGFGTAGDLGTVEPDGSVVVRGRADAAVTTGGHTVLAEDVEAVLAALPGVRAVAVVGTPHPRLGAVVTAVVELAPAADLSAVRSAARAVLTGPALPRRWRSVPALPRTASGKVARGRVAVDDGAAHGQ